MKTLTDETLRLDLTLFQTYLNLSEFVHSATNQVLFEGLATEEYELDVRQLTTDQAKMYLSLVNMAGHFLEVTTANPSVAMAFPDVVAKGLERAYYRLSPMKPLFEGILVGTLTEADLDYYQLKQGLRSHTRHRRENRAA